MKRYAGAGTIVQSTVTSLANTVVLEAKQGSFAETPPLRKRQ